MVSPVNAPFSWPNNSLSSSSGIAATFNATKALPSRTVSMNEFATSSLPGPDGPVIKTDTLVDDKRPMALKTSCIAGALPIISGGLGAS